MKERISEIESKLTAFRKDNYSKKDLLSEMLKLQEEIINTTFNATHAENSSLRLSDVDRHLTQLNEDCGHVADDLLAKFSAGQKQLREMIKGQISGDKGEMKATKSLQTVSRNVKVLRNIELKNDDYRTEIDIIAITNDSLFLIEVKNTSKDVVIDERGNYLRVTYGGDLAFDKNIGEKMNEKEHLMRTLLKNSGYEDLPIKSLVVFTNSSIHVTNNYEYIKECYLSQLPHIIDNSTSNYVMTDKQIIKLTECIFEAHCKESYPVKMDMKSFKSTFATLLAKLEGEKAKLSAEEEFSKKKNPFIAFFKRISKVACLTVN